MDDNEFIYSMKIRGYAVFENVLGRQTVEHLEETLSTLAENRLHDGVIRNLFDKLPVDCLVELIENKVVLPKIDLLLGSTFIYYSFNSSPLFPGKKSRAGDFHRDGGRYIPGYNHSINVLFAVTDFTEKTGVTHVIPGSHHVDQMPSQTYIDENTVDIDMPAGAALIFDSNLWHSAGWNTFDRTRWGMGLTCKRSYMRQQFDLPRMLSPDLVNQLSERCRQLLGFYVRMPASMEEYLLPEEERLYKAGQG